MKRLNTSIVFLMLSLMMSQVRGQDFAFRVLASKGDNQLKARETEDVWRPLKTGEKLKAGDEIKAAEDTYLGLVHHSGKTLEIKQAGHYTASQLVDLIKKGESTVLGKYANFLMTKMSEEEQDVVKDYRRYQNATGAVKRAMSSATALKVLMSQTTTVLGPMVTIRWIEADLPEKPAYVVTLKDKFSKTIKTLKTKEPFITIGLEESAMANQDLIIFDVRVAGKKRYRSEEYGIKKLDVKGGEDLKEELAAINEGNVQSAMGYLLKATFFEENELLLDAITAYEKAIDLEPEVAEFKMLYSRFISAQKF